MKLIIAAALILPTLAHAYTRTEAVANCQGAAEVVKLMADRRDEGMTKKEAALRIGNEATQEQRNAALGIIDLVWSFPQISGFSMQADFYKSCMKQQVLRVDGKPSM